MQNISEIPRKKSGKRHAFFCLCHFNICLRKHLTLLNASKKHYIYCKLFQLVFAVYNSIFITRQNKFAHLNSFMLLFTVSHEENPNSLQPDMNLN